MSDVRNRHLLRLNGMTLIVLAQSLLVGVGGLVAYIFAAGAAALVLFALATANPESLSGFRSKFRVELSLAALAIVGIIVTTAHVLPPELNNVFIVLVLVMLTAFLTTTVLKMLRMLYGAAQTR